MSEFMFNPLDSDTQREPFETFARARREQPVHVHPPLADRTIVSVFCYDDVLAVLRDAETFSNEGIGPPLDPGVRPNMLGLDAPEHTRLRGLVNMAFTPRIVRRLEAHLVDVADGLLDRALETGSVDLIDALSYPLPVIAIAEVLGIPSEDRDMFRAWSKIVVGTAGVGIGPRPSDERMADRKRARDEMAAYFTEMAQARRKDPREDLLSGLVHAEVEGHRLDFEEMLEMLILLLLAGNETTTNLIANSVVQLVDHPDAMAALRADPGKVPSGIEEVLRYDSPIQADPRRASREVELRGVKIPADATVFSWLGSANRDERVFERPEEFLVDRDPNRHISFGFGQHYCLGANLARLETRVALRGLLARTSDIQLTNREPLPLHPSFIFRGPQALPVLLKAA